MIVRKDARYGKFSFPKFNLTFLFVMFLSLSFQTLCFATTVTLQWGSSSGATGYRVYYQPDSSSQPFNNVNDVQNKTTTTISGLDPAHPYYFAITAYNTAGESAYSNVVSVPELTAPTVTAFTLPSSAIGLTVPITAFTATDNVSVTGYCVTQANSSSGCSWSSSKPSSVTFSSYGSQTAYAWAKDAAGNISNAKSASVTIAADTTAPTVTLTAPANGAVLSGTATISATATDTGGISRVEFYAGTTLLNATNISPYSSSWNTKSAANGSYTIYAKAYDTANNVKQSSSVYITVSNSTADTTAPTISISSPTAGSIISGTYSVNATASDNVGVSKVEFYIDGVSKSTDTASPYSYSWNTTSVSNGTHTIYAKAYDTANNVKQSSTVSVTVSNSTPATVPGAPTIGTATRGNAQATVSFTAPSSNGGSAITSYAVTSSSGKTATGAASPITVTGLTNGTAYTFTVKATNSVGTGPASAASNSVTPAATNADKTAPTISISSPVSYIYGAGSVVISANASDNIGVTKVEFYMNNVLKATDTSSPFSFTWNTSSLATGLYTFYGKAYDAAGNVQQSSPLQIYLFKY